LVLISPEVSILPSVGCSNVFGIGFSLSISLSRKIISNTLEQPTEGKIDTSGDINTKNQQEKDNSAQNTK